MTKAFLMMFCVAGAIATAASEPWTTEAEAPATGAEVRFSNETIPPNGTVQFKLSLTEPRPIMTGTKTFAASRSMVDAVYGTALFSPAGDAFGVATYQNGQFSIQFLSPLSSYGPFVDYPILTVAAHVSPNVTPGTTSPITIGAGSFGVNSLGQSFAFVENKPGTLTAGGSLFINNIVPGSGVWSAGTVIKILGGGFSASTRLKTKFITRSVHVISDSEIEVVLAASTRMDTQKIQVSNPDGSTVAYYSYLRPVDNGQSANPTVAGAIPVFPFTGVRQASVSQNSRGINGTVLTALSIQNGNPGPVTLTLTASTAMGRLGQTTITLQSGQKITREVGEYFGLTLPVGAVVRMQASAPVELVPFLADTATGAFTPFAAAPF